MLRPERRPSRPCRSNDHLIVRPNHCLYRCTRKRLGDNRVPRHFPNLITLVIVLAQVLAASGAHAGGLASPGALSKLAPQGYETPFLLVHGFHCREEYGWEPATGYYQHHKHLGICADLDRCTREQKRCLRVYGRGWNKWESIRWGFDNRYYQACMIRADCY